MKTDWLRNALIAGIAFISFLLVIRYNNYQEEAAKEVAQQVAESSSSAQVTAVNSDIPEAVEIHSDTPEAVTTETTVPSSNTNQSRIVEVHTDVLNISIDLQGGDIVQATLPTFLAEIDNPDKPFQLMDNKGSRTYMARSGLVGQNGTDKSGQRPVFKSSANDYRLQDGQDELVVDLSYQQNENVSITKRYRFKRESHLVNISYIVNNQSAETWRAQLFGDIRRDDYNPTKPSMFAMQPFLGAATTTNEDNYKKVKFSDMSDEAFKHQKEGGWVAMVQHYFLTAWIPPEESTINYTLAKVKNRDLYKLQWVGGDIQAQPGAQATIDFSFYAGPKHIKKLEKISPYLDLTVDYGFLWMIAKPLFYGLDAIHSVVGNWGVAIILITLLIKILFFYPSAASYKSMARMRKVQPKMAQLKERYGDNRQKFSQEMMKLYKEEKVNPVGGCLPMLIQMPVFLSLYWVLMESVELRQAPFMLWIEDLSVKDPYFVLPLIMGATMWFQQKLNPTPPDPMQAKIMQMMPIFFTFLFLFFPSGLVLYWVVNNTLSITQQYIITKQIEKSN